MNSAFVLFELIFTNLPILPWMHLPATVILLAMYLGVAYLTHATQGFYRTFIFFLFPALRLNLTSPSAYFSICLIAYAFLDPKQQGALLAGYIVGIGFGQAIIFVLVRYAVMLRIHLAGRTAETPSHSDDDKDDEKVAV
jgi:hypothetical protein